MKITKQEYNFLSYVYLDMCGDDEITFFKYHHRKRLDDYFISHLTKKKIRMSYTLVKLLSLIITSPSSTDAITNEIYLNSQQFNDLSNKLKNYLGIS
mgnify:CR=1 FL=1|tara:strand:+ start:502 stop:792 length:291 start_codon:yes stop_codon:yes gene_type:complete